MKRTQEGSVCEVAHGFEVQTTWKLITPQVERKADVEVMKLTQTDCWILLGLLAAACFVCAGVLWAGYEVLCWVGRSLHVL